MAVPISNVTRRQVYAPSGAGGAGPYAFTFEILANTDIAVYKDDTLLTLTTHYTVVINANGTGSVTITAAGLALAPVSPTQYAIVGNRTIARTSDFTTGGDFFANTLNDELDQQTIFAQQNAEGVARSLAAPQTDPTSINMTLPRASLRANKALGFDANGNPVISDTLGTNRGNWAAGVLYYVRDIVKDTTNNNIWQVITQHTSSGSQPINTNADAAKWTLLVDAASATTSATNAAASASAASTSASNASTSASNASTSASNASTSASNAASSASAASTSASNAAASYDSFDDRYLGPKSSAPSVDNDGNSLLTGALYWDTVVNTMEVWSGSAWVNVNASASNTRTAITATAGQTVLTVATYTPGTNTMVVYVNGVKLNFSEYTETNANTVTLTTGLALNDEVEVFSYQVNAVGSLGASSVTIADTGNYYAGGNVETALQEAATFTQAGAGAVLRTVNAKLKESASVKDFGVVGDGIANDVVAIQAAFDAVKASRADAKFDDGKTSLIPTKVALFGTINYGRGFTVDGRGATLNYTGTGPAFEFGSVSVPAPEFRLGARVSGLNLTGPGIGSTATGISVLSTAEVYYRDSYVYGFGHALKSTGGLTSEFKNLTLRNSGYGYYGDEAVGFAPNQIRLEGCTFLNNTKAVYQEDFSEGTFLLESAEIAENNPSGTAADNTAVVDFVNAGWATVAYTHTEANYGQYCIRYAGADADKGLLILGSNLISSTNDSQVRITQGNLTAISSRIVGATKGMDFASGSTGVIINVEGQLAGSLGNVLVANKGRLSWGSQPAASDPLMQGTSAAITAASNKVAKWTNNTIVEDYHNTAGTKKHIRGFVNGSQSYWLNVDDIPINFYINDAGAWTMLSSAFLPATDNTKSIGSGGQRASVIFAGTGTINTSDKREKQDIADLNAAELRVAIALKGLIKKFRFKDAVQKKGDGARIHVGVLAQDVMAVFQAEGLDPMQYAIVCYDEWDAAPATVDHDGKVMLPAREAGSRYGVRYEELLAFIIAAM